MDSNESIPLYDPEICSQLNLVDSGRAEAGVKGKRSTAIVQIAMCQAGVPNWGKRRPKGWQS
ncbi:MAG TPA: hypothetical protein VLE48_02450 [Terriglobales bacterium]|nr:hypothetical protein [Terriglobales bacterium]